MERLGYIEFVKTKELAEKIFIEEVITYDTPPALALLAEKSWLAACIFKRFMIAKGSESTQGALTTGAILAAAYKDAGLEVREEKLDLTKPFQEEADA